MTVAQPTTPANYFHLLRWQGLSGRRKPLIVFTPKSMLRLKAATSPTSAFTSGSFQPLIGERRSSTRRRCARSCSARARSTGTWSRSGRPPARRTAIVRVERLYPLPLDELKAELARYPQAEDLVWAQEEPANMGAWPRMALKLPELLGRKLQLVSLPPSSAPATGSAKQHATTHKELIEAALT